MVYLFSGKVYKNLVYMPTACSPERRPVSEDLTVFLKGFIRHMDIDFCKIRQNSKLFFAKVLCSKSQLQSLA